MPKYSKKKWNKKHVRLSHNCYSYMLNKINKDYVKKCKAHMRKTKKYMNVLDDYFGKLVKNMHYLRGYVFKDSPLSTIKFPVNIFRLIKRVKEQFNINSTIVSNLNPIYIVNQVEELTKELGKDGFGNQMFNNFSGSGGRRGSQVVAGHSPDGGAGGAWRCGNQFRLPLKPYFVFLPIV